MPQKLFVAAGHDGIRVTSPDGKTWSPPELGKEGEIYKAIGFGKEHLVVIGSFGGNNILTHSVDRTSWKTQSQDAKYSRYIRGVVFGNNAFFALGGDPGSVGSAAPFVLISDDGEKWTGPENITGKFMLRRAAYGDGLFVGVGDRGRRASSKNGREWTDTEKPLATDTLIDIAFGGGVFVGVGLHGLRMLTTDGLNWSDRVVGEEGEHLNSIVWANDRFVAVGAGATYFSSDGVHWERHPNRDAPLAVAFGDGVFVGTRWKGRVMCSKDAVHWEEVLKCDQHLEAIGFGELA